MIKNSTFSYLTALVGILFFQSTIILAQEVVWNPVSQESISEYRSEPILEATEAEYYEVDFETLTEKILNSEDGDLISFPVPNGRELSFKLKVNTTMHPGLAAKFPSIGSYDVISLDSRNTWGKMDISPTGMRAVIMEPGESSIYIEPVFKGNANTYVVYRGEDFIENHDLFSCELSDDTRPDSHPNSSFRGDDYNDCFLRTYRIAVATTGEWSNLHGDATVEGSLAAVVTVVNQINAVWERDFALTTTLIENNEDIIFLNPSSDPYTNNSNNAMLNENQETLDEIIGDVNYDIGHVFAVGGGGVAQLNSTCNGGSKARCVTSYSFGPLTQRFTKVANHEMGHQFSGTHTFNNSCGGNRTNLSAMEPGSGSTILSYGGTCPPNIMSNSDLFFHGKSMEQIGDQVGSCGEITILDNSSPELEDLPEILIIPANTPFALTAQASDADGDELTYSWEQIDIGIVNQLPDPLAVFGINFRSFPPTVSPTRYFPSLPNAQNTTWEVLPDGFREMTFRVSVRDNAPGGGCTQYDDILVEVNDDGGPFILEVPSNSGISWDPETTETVVWDVADTDDEEFQGELVDIFLSVDGGFEYTILLADDVPNDGSHEIQVPLVAPTTTARVMVMNSAGTFFDVSDNNFSITGLLGGFNLVVDDNFNTCQGEDAVYTISLEAAFNFSEQVTLSTTSLPSGVDASFGDNTLFPGESTTLTISNTSSGPLGVSTIGLLGLAGEFSSDVNLDLNLNEAPPSPANLFSPENGATEISAIQTFEWSESASAITSYSLEIAFDSDFTDLYGVFSNITTPFFQVETVPLESELFWRVRENNGCGEVVSETRSFSTDACQLRFAQDVPVNIPAIAGTTESELQVDQPGTIERIRLTNLVGTHGRVSDLTMSLTSPEGTEVSLFSEICGSDDDFNLSFEDGGIGVIDCPPTTSLFYAADEALAAFNGEEASGVWTLNIEDSENGSGGSLEGWQLDICYEGSILSTSSEDGSEISIYPNPTSGQVEIQFAELSKYTLIQVLDIRGRLIEVVQIRPEENLKRLDLSQYEPGVYILSFIGEGLGKSVKIVKQD